MTYAISGCFHLHAVDGQTSVGPDADSLWFWQAQKGGKLQKKNQKR